MKHLYWLIALLLLGATGRPLVATQLDVSYLLEPADVDTATAFFSEHLQEPFKKYGALSAAYGKQQRTVTYYDDRDRKLLAGNMELLHTVTENLPVYRANREQVIFKDFNATPPLAHAFEAQRYNRKITPIDKHPLFGLVRRKERPMLLGLLPANTKPESLQAVLQAKYQEYAFLVSHFGETIGIIRLSDISLSNFGIPTHQLAFNIKILPDAFADLKPEEQQALLAALTSIQRSFQQLFPEKKPIGKLGYEEFHRLANEKLPTHDLFSKYPLVYQLGQILLLSFIGGLFLLLAIKRHTRSPAYRLVHRKKSP